MIVGWKLKNITDFLRLSVRKERDMFRRKISHQVRLSGLHYENTGVSLPWNAIRLFIPYEQLRLNPAHGCLLEEVKGNFKTDLDLLLYGNIFTGVIESTEVDPEGKSLQELASIYSNIGQFVKEIGVLVAERNLTLALARQILDRMGYRITDECLNRMLVKIVSGLPSQRYKETLDVSLSKLIYREDGVTFHDKNIRHKVEKQLLSFEPRSVFNTIRSTLTGEMQVELSFDFLPGWDPKTAHLLIGQISANVVKASMGRQVLDDFEKQRIDSLCKAITDEKRRSVERLKGSILEWGFKPADRLDGERIAAAIPAWMETYPAQIIPMRSLHYEDTAVTCRLGIEDVHVDISGLPFRPAAFLEKIRTTLPGEIQVQASRTMNFKWIDHDPYFVIENKQIIIEKLDVGAEDKKMLEKYAAFYLQNREALEQPAAESSKLFIQLLCKLICGSIVETGNKSDEYITHQLSEWALSPADREIGQLVTAGVPVWADPMHDYKVPLNAIRYDYNKITVDLNGVSVEIPSGNLPFKISKNLELIKDVFEGEITVPAANRYQLRWQAKEPHFTIEPAGYVIGKIVIDEETRVRFENIFSLFVKLQGSFSMDRAVEIIHRRATTSDHVPEEEFHKDYDRACIKILESKAQAVYVTSEDLWFHIKDALVWEIPDYGRATYVFHWPGKENLDFFMGTVWASTLQEIRNSSESGYVGRVKHDPDAPSAWAANLNPVIAKAHPMIAEFA